jgi:replicative DNA helicase
MTAPTRHVLDDVTRLLLRFGISTRLSASDDGAALRIEGRDDLRRFLQEIGLDGSHSASATALLERMRDVRPSPSASDELPWSDVRDVLTSAEAAGAAGRGGGALAAVADRLALADLEIEAVNDLLWDEVVAIEPLGEQAVFDATVVGTHNFVANGIAVHNSIEQDADMVILLHREDAYEKESPRAGEADLIVAKHRNGPTDTITVAFQGHYSRFVDMQM